MNTLDDLMAVAEAEARNGDVPIDVPVYERAGKSPQRPILCAGSLRATLAVMGRDLGRDEVAAGQPLIGAGGRLVRAGIYRAYEGAEPPEADRPLAAVLDHALLTNTVPYKPPGNKAYSSRVKERFRPIVATLLGRLWAGDRLITLGNEAFHWFAPYADDPGAFETFWARDDRYEASIAVTLTYPSGDGPAGGDAGKRLTLLPLPHPSPLNARWYGRFPSLLAQRLSALPPA